MKDHLPDRSIQLIIPTHRFAHTRDRARGFQLDLRDPKVVAELRENFYNSTPTRLPPDVLAHKKDKYGGDESNIVHFMYLTYILTVKLVMDADQKVTRYLLKTIYDTALRAEQVRLKPYQSQNHKQNSKPNARNRSARSRNI